MKLTDKAIAEIKGSTRLKNRLALALNRSVYTIDRWLQGEQEDQMMLTTATALQVIREETGLTDSEILEAEPVTAGQTGE